MRLPRRTFASNARLSKGQSQAANQLISTRLRVGQLAHGRTLWSAVFVAGVLAGTAVLSRGIACWPGTPLFGTLTHSRPVTGYLAYLGIRGESVGPMLWPTVALHAVLTILLAHAWFPAQPTTQLK